MTLAVILIYGCKKKDVTPGPAVLIQGNWQLTKKTINYFKDGVPTTFPSDTSGVILTGIRFNADQQTGIEKYNVFQPPFTYTLSNNRLIITCVPGYDYHKPTDVYDPNAIYYPGFSDNFNITTLTNQSLTLFSSNSTTDEFTQQVIKQNTTLYFSKIQ